MVSTTDLHFLTIAEVGPLIREGQLSPVDLTRAYLERIDAVDGRLDAFVTLLREEALSQARQAEAEIRAGNYRGPLHGIPVALKDLYDTAGIRTTAMSRVMPDRVPDEDATTVAKLYDAGVVLLGKLAMHEFASGGPDPTSLFPPARNPWNTEHMPGGSSSGSGAAVAAGLCMGALGSDTGGSIRGPASMCGIVGIKPTFGRVSNFGVVPLSWSQDHCGPMTWTVEDAAIMLQAIAGYDPRDPTTADVPVPDYRAGLRDGVRGLTVGVPREYFYEDAPGVDAQVIRAAERALETLAELGAEIREVEIPHIKYAQMANQVITLSEAFSFHETNLKTRRQDYGNMVRNRFMLGGLLSASDYNQALRMRRVIKDEMAAALRQADVLVTPTYASTAPRIEGYSGSTTLTQPSFTGPFNVSGLPAVSVPCGLSDDGLPMGLQVVGKPFDESTVLRVAYGYEQTARFIDRRPPI
jgi:aspartyl-tRNA(Asn)/glutamyl-tRNA(Gln) amidotransferase subunit A